MYSYLFAYLQWDSSVYIIRVVDFPSCCWLLYCQLILVLLICTVWIDIPLFYPLCRHKVVIVEGNYLLLDDGVWKEISSLFDEKWQVLILLRHKFLLIFSFYPWKFWELYVNSPVSQWLCSKICFKNDGRQSSVYWTIYSADHQLLPVFRWECHYC